MKRSSTPVEQFLASLPDPPRTDLVALDARIAEAMAGDDRVLWEGAMWGGTAQRIIGYGSYRYVNSSGTQVDWFVVGLAMQKSHLSLYVNAVEDGAYLVKRYADRLGKAKVGSANVTFKRLSDIELDVLLEMVERARDLIAKA
jgi:adenylosuccinate synthase